MLIDPTEPLPDLRENAMLGMFSMDVRLKDIEDDLRQVLHERAREGILD